MLIKYGCFYSLFYACSWFYVILLCFIDPVTNWWTWRVKFDYYRQYWGEHPQHRFLCIYCFLCEILFSFPSLNIFLFVSHFSYNTCALNGKIFKKLSCENKNIPFFSIIITVYTWHLKENTWVGEAIFFNLKRNCKLSSHLKEKCIVYQERR